MPELELPASAAPWLAGVSLMALLGSVAYAVRRRPCVDGACGVAG
ncbi:hypothetical protein [Humibacillus xanthopallidus]|nr:hypothetical protein [Humibacillus xanthopallidus]